MGSGGGRPPRGDFIDRSEVSDDLQRGQSGNEDGDRQDNALRLLTILFSAAAVPQRFGNLNQVIVALGKTIRAMADGNLDSQVGSRICSGLGIMRQCLETQTLDRLGERLDQLEGARGESVSYGDTKHHQSHHVAH
jgi:hypothetical protein